MSVIALLGPSGLAYALYQVLPKAILVSSAMGVLATVADPEHIILHDCPELFKWAAAQSDHVLIVIGGPHTVDPGFSTIIRATTLSEVWVPLARILDWKGKGMTHAVEELTQE